MGRKSLDHTDPGALNHNPFPEAGNPEGAAATVIIKAGKTAPTPLESHISGKYEVINGKKLTRALSTKP